MSAYRRIHVPGGTYFFTVCLADRASDLLLREVSALRRAVRITMAERPFQIDAFVVLPDHLHTVWTLPCGDADFSVRWGAIKSRFTREVRRVGFNPTLPQSPSKRRKGDAGIWQRRFWEGIPKGLENFLSIRERNCIRCVFPQPRNRGVCAFFAGMEKNMDRFDSVPRRINLGSQ